MQTRIGFNGGEMSPEMACRVDMESYLRGCNVLENWELSQMGGIRRRRGMRYMTGDLSESSIIIPYIYSYDPSIEGVFLIELDGARLRVLSPLDGGELASFSDGSFYLDTADLQYKQINNLLLLITSYNRPMVLSRDEAGAWELEPWEFKNTPWRYNEIRDEELKITRLDDESGARYTVDFGENAESESLIDGADTLRASYWVERAQLQGSGREMREGIIPLVLPFPEISAGQKVAEISGGNYRYYTCRQEWTRVDNYLTGMNDPDNYPDNFVLCETEEGEGTLVYVTSLADFPHVEKGVRLALDVKYWKHYTCIRDLTASDIVEGATSPADYPYHFIEGIAVGEAVPCRGTWSFFCSGVWYGEYQVRRSYEGASLMAAWEGRGSSSSFVGEASNTQLTGDESEEECYLQLFITKTRRTDWEEFAEGWPADSCENRLIIDGYKKHLTFSVTTVEDEAGEIVSHDWQQVGGFPLYWQGSRVFTDWSWAAFSDRYGFPQLCEVYNQRLVFAATRAQPQTIWMSRVDDLNNFMLSDTDNAALELTMSTSSQNPIMWLIAQNHRLLLGTAEAEWIISAGQSQAAITPTNAQLEDHGHIGSERLVLAAVDRVLYLERGAGRVYEYGYSIETDGYRSKDLTVFAPHVLSDHGGAVSSTLLRKPDTTAVFALADGQLALMTYNSFHNVNAWHRWTTNGKILSVCALPNGRGADRLFLIVQREDEISLEVVDEYSGYADGMHDYASTMVTNALSNPMEQPVGKAPQQGTAFRFGAAWDAEGVEITRDGVDWMQVSRSGEQVAGWHELIAPAKWQHDNTVGLRLSGDRGIHILALQG